MKKRSPRKQSNKKDKGNEKSSENLSLKSQKEKSSTETKSKWYEILLTLLAALILGFLLILSLTGCQSRPVLVKPDSVLTVNAPKHKIECPTWRCLAESYIKRGEAIDDANARFEAIRN